MKISLDLCPIPVSKAGSNIDEELLPFIAKTAGISEKDILGYSIERKSIDARKKPHVNLNFRVIAEVSDHLQHTAMNHLQIVSENERQPRKRIRDAGTLRNPIVIGSGPAGLFAALTLAESGAEPIIFERGKDVDGRKKDINLFRENGILNPESNYLFGEGGAGTWSDGKLFTRIHDPSVPYVLQEFVRAGASPSISYFAHPHIGSDKLPEIVKNIRKRIISLGGRFLWNSCVSDIFLRNGVCRGVRLENGEMHEAPLVIAAVGHGARAFLISLLRHEIPYQMKGFQLGVRIEHHQNWVNLCQYGMKKLPPCIGPAEYHLSSSPNAQTNGSASFCMCPGGEIIAAVSEHEHLCTNGMSNSSRSGKFSNAALIATIPATTFPSAQEAFSFLDAIERSFYAGGGGNWIAPAQYAIDFLHGTTHTIHEETSYHFGIKSARIDSMLPETIRTALQRALFVYDKKMPQFIKSGLFIGVETHISLPFRFTRDVQTFQSGIPGLFLCGEGAGMAGGIVSAAVDGMLCAEAIMH